MIEETWSGFDYGAKRMPIKFQNELKPGRIVQVIDPDSGRTLNLKMTEDEAQQFGELIKNPPEAPVVAPASALQGLPGLPGNGQGPRR